MQVRDITTSIGPRLPEDTGSAAALRGHLEHGTEFPPLLVEGIHYLTFDEVRAMCVDAFPNSGRRSEICEGIERIANKLCEVGLKCELWLDGSFLTKKPEPGDCDLVLRLDEFVAGSLTVQQHRVVEWIASNLKNELSCDSYVFAEIDENDPRRGDPEHDMRAYWLKWFGTSRSGAAKGIACLALGASNV